MYYILLDKATYFLVLNLTVSGWLVWFLFCFIVFLKLLKWQSSQVFGIQSGLYMQSHLIPGNCRWPPPPPQLLHERAKKSVETSEWVGDWLLGWLPGWLAAWCLQPALGGVIAQAHWWLPHSQEYRIHPAKCSSRLKAFLRFCLSFLHPLLN